MEDWAVGPNVFWQPPAWLLVFAVGVCASILVVGYRLWRFERGRSRTR